MRRIVTRFIPVAVLAAGVATACADSATGPEGVASLEVSAPELFVAVGDSIMLEVQARDASGASVAAAGVQWSSLDRQIATVDNRGMAFGVAQGVARITASAGSVRDTFRLSVGGMMTFNVSTVSGTAFCSLESAEMREAELRAISDHAIIYEDTSNPPGGLTARDYESIAATFDTLIHPVVAGSFGTPSDIDRNGRVIILYTGAVNELTPSGSSSHVAGFHFARDLLPRAPSGGVPGCAASNAAEMFFMMVPDPRGDLGNVRTRDFVFDRTMSTIGHEYQHLINASRRLYQLGASELEAVWLNEGLSHIAEELLFYRAGGMVPLQQLGVEQLTSSRRRASAFNEYASSNYGRLGSYMEQPDRAGPYHSTDNIAARGAAWSFLRYAADRSARADEAIWKALAGSAQIGFPNLDAAMGAATRRWVADWAVANAADRFGTATPDVFRHRSWRHHNILGELGRPTLRVWSLNGSSVVSRSVVAGGSVHVAFRVGAAGGGVFPRIAGGSTATSCGGATGRTLEVGEVIQGSLAEMAAVCLAPASGAQNFVLTATHLSGTSGASITLEVGGTGLQNPAFAARVQPPDGLLLQMAPAEGAGTLNAPSAFELELREREKEDLERLLGGGRGVADGGPSLQTGGVAGDVVVSIVRVP